jgi:hypothetical protein
MLKCGTQSPNNGAIQSEPHEEVLSLTAVTLDGEPTAILFRCFGLKASLIS